MVASFAPSVSIAGSEEAESALQNGNYKVALKEFRALSKAGDARGHFGLGVMYNEGLGVPKDFSESVKWYRAAVNQGHNEAKNNLGIMYFNGLGVDKSDEVAASCFMSAAKSGIYAAEKNLQIVMSKSAYVRAMVRAISEFERRNGGPLTQGGFKSQEPRGLPYCG